MARFSPGKFRAQKNCNYQLLTSRTWDVHTRSPPHCSSSLFLLLPGISSRGSCASHITESQQVIAAVDQLAFENPRVFSQDVRGRGLLIDNVQHRVSAADQIVRDQHAMTTKKDALRAHDGRVRALCAFNQSLNRSLKLG